VSGSTTTGRVYPRSTPPSPLRLRRLSLGLTVQDVAGAAGLNRQWLTVLERGGAYPRWRTALALAEVLDCDPLEIFPPENDDDPEASRVAVTTKQVDCAHRALDSL
jgi:transcriptional regulator with XRE-family HTH domain